MTSIPSYFLQDSRNNVGDNLMFWATLGGYTSNILEAEPFPESKAFAQNNMRESDVPWPTGYILSRTRPVVDMQYVKEAEARKHRGSEQFYLERLPRTFVGNDIVFVAASGTRGVTDLSKARVFSRSELFEGDVQKISGIAWPKNYIDSKSRPAVEQKVVDLKKSLGPRITQVKKFKKPRPTRYRCHGCGIFQSAEGHYCGPCVKCHCDNRP